MEKEEISLYNGKKTNMHGAIATKTLGIEL